MASPSLTRIDEFRLTTLRDLLSQCTEGQQSMFWKMYNQFGGRLEDIPKEKLDWAIQQCERSVTNNSKKTDH